jgi:hypothetical protein
MNYELTSDSNGCYWAKCPPNTCPVDLPRRLLEEYWAEIVHVKAQYWRCIPAPSGDDFGYYIHRATGPGPGAFWACEVEVRYLTKQQTLQEMGR